jgi:hypothetical protein
MGAACSQHWRDKKLLLTESVLGTARDSEWDGNIRIGLQEMGRSYADWIVLARIGTGDGCCEHIDERP